MSRPDKPTARKPATKFAHLRKKMEQTRLRANVKKLNIRKSAGR